MAADTFLQALQRITAGELDLGGLIGIASALKDDGDGPAAEQLYKVCMNFNAASPQLYAAAFNLSTLLTGADDGDAAIAALETALKSKADFWPAMINLGSALERKGDANGAVARWRQVVDQLDQVNGANVGLKLTALKQISRVLIDHQQAAPAEGFLAECLRINPRQRDALEQYMGLRMQQCHWPALEPLEGASREQLMEGVSPLSTASYTDDPLLQLAVATRYVDNVLIDAPPNGASDRRTAPISAAGERLKVGYVSSDLRDHAVGYLMGEVFELHDPAQVETFAYYCGPPPSGAMYERFKASAEHWIDISGLSDDAAAAQVAADRIDILVDVNGHTRFARIGLFARRPAPIIVNWLGFPGTAGSACHHYLVADPHIVPPEAEIYYSEKVLRLPCYQPNDRKRQVATETPARAEAGLPESGFVFCCFNGTQKITRFQFDRWLEILRRAPEAVLWLLESDAATNERLAARAEAAGIDRARLVFAPKKANAAHLARYALADLFLDTFPYGAHTTCSDALWMGVPVLTLAGRGFASRVCGSLLAAAGLEGLTVTAQGDYVERAVALAADPDAIAAYKAQLAANRDSCVLFDTPLLVSSLEALYAEMAADYRRGELPRPDLTNMEAYLRAGVEHDPDTREIGEAPDYRGLYLERLTRRHRIRPIGPDARLWTPDAIAAAEPERPEAEPAVRLVSKAS